MNELTDYFIDCCMFFVEKGFTQSSRCDVVHCDYYSIETEHADWSDVLNSVLLLKECQLVA